MPSFALTKFQELANATNGKEAANLMFTNPVLLAPSTWPELRTGLGTARRRKRPEPSAP
jgi:hypothetical protein